MATHEEAKSRVEQIFWSHVAAFAIIASGLIVLSFGESTEEMTWIIAAWATAVLIHALLFFSPDSQQQMVKRTHSRMDWRRQNLTSRRSLTR
ncbi:MAG: 2TM domain-containing protein [Planctomycetaceae bacterium]|nr:2TM domain-containing protein [Planctomycetaceae bacterium]